MEIPATSTLCCSYEIPSQSKQNSNSWERNRQIRRRFRERKRLGNFWLRQLSHQRLQAYRFLNDQFSSEYILYQRRLQDLKRVYALAETAGSSNPTLESSTTKAEAETSSGSSRKRSSRWGPPPTIPNPSNPSMGFNSASQQSLPLNNVTPAFDAVQLDALQVSQRWIDIGQNSWLDGICCHPHSYRKTRNCHPGLLLFQCM